MRITIGRALALLGCYLLVASVNFLYSQEVERLTDAISRFKPAVSFEIPSEKIDFSNRRAFGFSTKGLVVKDRTSVTCYRPDGSIVWTRKPPEPYVAIINVSDNGEFIVAYYKVNEVTGVVEVLTSDGNVLWRKNISAGFRLSPNGKYLYSMSGVLSGMPLTVIETSTGKILWRHVGRPGNFREELLDEETLVYIDWGKLEFIDMSSGALLKQRDISGPFSNELSHVTWDLAVSEDGNYFTVLGRSSSQVQKTLFLSFNRKMELLSTVVLDNPYGQLVGLTEDGSKLCINYRKFTRLYDTFTGKLLWEIEERILNHVGVVTNQFIAMWQVDYSEVFVLASDGSLAHRYKSNSIFVETKLPQMASKEGTITLSKSDSRVKSSIVEIKKDKDNEQASVTFYVKETN